MDENYKEMWQKLYQYFGLVLDNAEDTETMLTFLALRALMRSTEMFGVGILDVDMFSKKTDDKKVEEEEVKE